MRELPEPRQEALSTYSRMANYSWLDYSYNAGATVQTSATLIKERYADGVTADGHVVIVNDERTFGLVLGGDNTFEYMGIFILYPLGGKLNAERTAAKQATTAFLSALPD